MAHPAVPVQQRAVPAPEESLLSRSQAASDAMSVYAARCLGSFSSSRRRDQLNPVGWQASSSESQTPV
jgi:hypothetical protein